MHKLMWIIVWMGAAGLPLRAQVAPGAAAPGGAVPAYFIDGYHGGIYGHIPPWQTRFMVDKLHQYPDWKINLEIEPESWDTIARKYPADYDAFTGVLADPAMSDRVEYVNPTYAQSYLYNISGESIIRQFYYGMRKLREHFPGITFSTYSSEEPCFTSALPQLLLSYGFSYASLKNPNTCWGGYTRAFGGELVYWTGPDGSRLVTVPRYAVESLKPKSTWETIASNNSVAYITRSLKAGIRHPVGMCLQDAGWAGGPWVKPGKDHIPGTPGETNDIGTPYMPTVYETWKGYIEKRSIRVPGQVWHFTQEDVLVSLVWGGQVLQRIAQQVRVSENKIIATEKLAAMATIYSGAPWPGDPLDQAWRTLLLSQHHDCWIVPYNERSGVTWADNVVRWTGNTNRICDSVADAAMGVLSGAGGASDSVLVCVFNTTAVERAECVSFSLPNGWHSAEVLDSKGRRVPCQPGDSTQWLFLAHVPSMGYATYYAKRGFHPAPVAEAAGITRQQDGTYRIETDMYSLVVDPAKGGTIQNLVAKKLHHKEFAGVKCLGELRGNFYEQGGFHTSTETPADVRILENGPLRVRLEIRGRIAATPFAELLTLTEGQKRIDVHLDLDWAANTGIGASPDSVRGYPLKKAFYNDSFKLQALFPLSFQTPEVYKNAPFDVLHSHLSNTFFDSWDSIKNVVLLNWVDETDAKGAYGLGLFSDHTTSYAHGENYPLGLTIQYSGGGLFGRDYTIREATRLDYALVPHAGTWDKAGLWTEATLWNEPLRTRVFEGGAAAPARSLLHIDTAGWEISSLTYPGKDLDVRIFNAEGAAGPHRVYPGFAFRSVQLVSLAGRTIRALTPKKDVQGRTYLLLAMPRFGVRTLQFNEPFKQIDE